MDSSDLNRRELKTTSYAFSGNYVNIEKDYKLSPSVRFDSREEHKKSTFNLGFEALNQFDNSNSSFDFNFDVGSSFQFPTMNDLFWPDGQYSGGNEELKPEESQYFAFSMSNQSFLGKIKLVDLRLTEAIFEKEDKTFIMIDFNNVIREADEY